MRIARAAKAAHLGDSLWQRKANNCRLCKRACRMGPLALSLHARPLLLILDGQSLKSEGLEAALAHGGWDLAVTTSAEAAAFVTGTETALLMLDPALSGEAGLQAVQAMRAMDREVPVVLLKGAKKPPRAKVSMSPCQGVVGSLGALFRPPSGWVC